jgi:hypothetical protein
MDKTIHKKPKFKRINNSKNLKVKLFKDPPKISMKEIFGVKSPKNAKVKKNKNKFKNSNKYNKIKINV